MGSHVKVRSTKLRQKNLKTPSRGSCHVSNSAGAAGSRCTRFHPRRRHHNHGQLPHQFQGKWNVQSSYFLEMFDRHPCQRKWPNLAMEARAEWKISYFFLWKEYEIIVESLKRKGVLKNFAIRPLKKLFLDRSGNRVHQGLHHFCSIAMPVCYPWYRIVALCFVLNLAQRTRCDIHMDCSLSTSTNNTKQILCLLSTSHCFLKTGFILLKWTCTIWDVFFHAFQSISWNKHGQTNHEFRAILHQVKNLPRTSPPLLSARPMADCRSADSSFGDFFPHEEIGFVPIERRWSSKVVKESCGNLFSYAEEEQRTPCTGNFWAVLRVSYSLR